MMNMKNLIHGHPKTNLYFFLGEEPTNDLAHEFELLLDSMSDNREWVIGPPELVDFIDEPDDDGEEVHTYGGVLEMYSALPPWGTKLPREIDKRHFEEAAAIVEELCGFSRAHHCQFELQLDDTYVGSIDNGSSDSLIQIDLLGEWKKAWGL